MAMTPIETWYVYRIGQIDDFGNSLKECSVQEVPKAALEAARKLKWNGIAKPVGLFHLPPNNGGSKFLTAYAWKNFGCEGAFVASPVRLEYLEKSCEKCGAVTVLYDISVL